jgi:hypothetical protein
MGGSAPADRLLLALLIVAIIGVPTLVFPVSLRIFVIPQVVLLWTPPSDRGYWSC